MGQLEGPMRRPPKYVHAYIDRHGKPRYYLRRPGCKQVPLPGLPWSPEFMEAYSAALDTAPKIEIGASRTKSGTVGDAIARYLRSGMFANLPKSTQTRDLKSTLERFRREHGDKRIGKLQPDHVGLILGKLKPYAARNMLLALKVLMTFAKSEGLIDADPTTGVKAPKRRDTGGYKTWPQEYIARYRKHHKIGTQARLAIELFLNVGARRGDTSRLGRQHLRNGEFFFRASKNGVTVEGVPILPELKSALAAMPSSGGLTFL